MCPTLKDTVEGSEIPADVNGVYEIVIDGIDEASVAAAMKAGIKAAVTIPGVKKITAGNYGGKLGPFQIKLQGLFYVITSYSIHYTKLYDGTPPGITFCWIPNLSITARSLQTPLVRSLISLADILPLGKYIPVPTIPTETFSVITSYSIHYTKLYEH